MIQGISRLLPSSPNSENYAILSEAIDGSVELSDAEFSQSRRVIIPINTASHKPSKLRKWPFLTTNDTEEDEPTTVREALTRN